MNKLATAARRERSFREGSLEGKGEKLDLAPGCTFGALVEQRLNHIEIELAEAKGRLNGLIFLVVGAVMVEVFIRLVK
ncbi:MAG: hypothetical protein HYX94_10045 [Chloroflexi bacterium]|nr:hypothetical protein [Chloroflexota bacterium]